MKWSCAVCEAKIPHHDGMLKVWRYAPFANYLGWCANDDARSFSKVGLYCPQHSAGRKMKWDSPDKVLARVTICAGCRASQGRYRAAYMAEEQKGLWGWDVTARQNAEPKKSSCKAGGVSEDTLKEREAVRESLSEEATVNIF